MVGYGYLEEVGFVLGVGTFSLPNVDEHFLVAYSLDPLGINSGVV
jgi:hypothetical protein